MLALFERAEEVALKVDQFFQVAAFVLSLIIVTTTVVFVLTLAVCLLLTEAQRGRPQNDSNPATSLGED